MDTSKVVKLVNGELDFKETVEVYQDMINSGEVWIMEGTMGRTAMALIESGDCMLGETSHRDYYGNYIPSRYEVKAGTKGSPEFMKVNHG